RTASSHIMLPVFIGQCPPMLNLIVLMNQIVTEKELKLRLGMRMMGLRNFIFWLSWFITNAFINVLSTLLLIASGWIAGFDFFTNTNLLVMPKMLTRSTLC